MPEILSLLSSGIVGGLLGAFFGGFAKFFWENWLPSELTWRREQKVEYAKLLSRYSGPAVRAISDLNWRLVKIVQGNMHYRFLVKHHLKDYYIKSTAFLIAQFFGWAEILRQKLQMLDYGKLFVKLEDAKGSFSHGQAGFQIFSLEQREIGERMIVKSADGGQDCIGYSDFLEMLQKDEVPACFARLESVVKNLMRDHFDETVRVVHIQHALIDLIDFMDPKARWILKSNRDKFDIMQELEDLLADKDVRLSKAVYNNIVDEAREAGLDKITAVREG